MAGCLRPSGRECRAGVSLGSPRGHAVLGLSSGSMTPQKVATTYLSHFQESCEDLARMYAIAASINTAEHVEEGSDEWALRERRKELFQQGVDIFNDKFRALQGW